MRASASGAFGGVGVLAGDPIDHVREIMLCSETGEEKAILGTGVEEDLANLVSRVEKVHSFCGRFSDVELSPFVKRMVELADKHRLAV